MRGAAEGAGSMCAKVRHLLIRLYDATTGDDDSSGREALTWVARGLGVAVKSIGQNELGQPMTLELLPGSSLNGRPIP